MPVRIRNALCGHRNTGFLGIPREPRKPGNEQRNAILNNRKSGNAGAPATDVPVPGDLAPSETSRGPRGLRRGIVYDLGRLYRLRLADIGQEQQRPSAGWPLLILLAWFEERVAVEYRYRWIESPEGLYPCHAKA